MLNAEGNLVDTSHTTWDHLHFRKIPRFKVLRVPSVLSGGSSDEFDGLPGILMHLYACRITTILSLP